MDRLVVDPSAIAEYLFRTERGLRVESIIEPRETDLHIPAICDLEVLAAVRWGLQRGLGDVSWAERVLQQHLGLPLTRHGHQLLLGRGLELRENLTAYDAAYVALAERLGSPLVTADASLARAARDHSTVEVREA
jgi:predicted nucleic acid-binding protein